MRGGVADHPGADLRVFIVHHDGKTLLEIGGELDLATVDGLAERLELIVEEGIGDVVVDMSMVTFCDALTLRVLMDAFQRLAAAGRALQVTAASHGVTRLLEAAGVSWLTDERDLPAARRTSC